MAILSLRACTSWRYVATAGHTNHLPGECTTCWVACGNTLTRDQWRAGIRRCGECAQSLVHCPIVAVRRALLDEPNPNEDTLRVLVTDSNGPVSMKARRMLDELVDERTVKPALPYGEIPLELRPSPRRNFRIQTQQSLAYSTMSTPAISAPRPSVWDR